MKAIILAAGKGTRLYPVTHHISKPLLPLANRMTIEYAFDQLKKLDVTDICVIVGEMENEMRQILGDGSNYGVRLSYERQTQQKGLAHAMSFAKEFVKNDNFILYLGDAMYDQNFIQHSKRFQESGCANLNIVKPVPNPTYFGVATLDGERIIKLTEKPKNPESNLAMAGLYFFSPKIWEVLPDLEPSARGEYEITDAIQLLINKGYKVLAGLYEGVWFDTGTLDSFLETSRFLVNNGCLIDDSATLNGLKGEHVVMGEDAIVSCTKIEDSVILPGAKICVEGEICHAVIGGDYQSNSSVINQLIYEG